MVSCFTKIKHWKMLKETLLRLNITKLGCFSVAPIIKLYTPLVANTAWSGHCVIPPTLAKPFEQTFGVSGLHKKCLFQHIVTSPPLYWGGNLRKCNLHFVTFIVTKHVFLHFVNLPFQDIWRWQISWHVPFAWLSPGNPMVIGLVVPSASTAERSLDSIKAVSSKVLCGNTICNQSANTAIPSWPLVGNEGMNPQYTNAKVDSFPHSLRVGPARFAKQ